MPTKTTLHFKNTANIAAAMASDIQLLIRKPAVIVSTGYSSSTLYRRIAERLFTKPVTIGTDKRGKACQVAWPSSEVSALNHARIAGKTDDEIRALVAELEAKRQMQSMTAHSVEAA